MRNRAILSEGLGGPLPRGDARAGCPLILTGGPPCQDLSIAGRQAGIDGSRSKLWRDYIQAVRAIGPDWIVWENVAHTWRRWVPIVRKELAVLGYASLPLRVRASDLGAPHQRSRIFLVAHADRQLLRVLSGWWVWKGREMAKELGLAWNQEPGVPRMDDGIPDRVDRNRAVGNAIVPQIAQIIARGIREVTAFDTKEST